MTFVNKNQVKGAVKDVVGKVQEEAGKFVGNKEQQAKGLQKQVAGRLRRLFPSRRQPRERNGLPSKSCESLRFINL